ncbi:hypothetical protein GCM10022223_05620 [Kineosporia mesophila]|uniref:Uncharacterized protein n=1 Tax=Kineosporia mesophila TaxID=566012 RepID=A0ABP6YYQ4_9ACTN|nr:hypothetical protein [Kineosporia mesophila]MCD5355229.1 hypothetical protein [Kineosporia mesophila]
MVSGGTVKAAVAAGVGRVGTVRPSDLAARGETTMVTAVAAATVITPETSS